MTTEPSFYDTLCNRNMGLLNKDQQMKIKETKVAISGLGGIGSPIAEMLCRLGFTRFSLLDHGTFELTNLNRQIFCYTDTEDLLKTDVTEQFMKKINPDVQIEKFTDISEENVGDFLKDAGVIVMGIDTVIPCLIISRAAQEKKIPMVEGWGVITGNVRVFNQDTPGLEEVYEMPTIGKPIKDITPEEEDDLLMHTLDILIKQIPGLKDQYPPAALERMELTGEGTTLAPLTWLTCTLMATEVMKVVLDWGNLALAPEFATYNPILHQTAAREKI
jgi:molybdopterin/thiamine biosynthesis adenylyltransferase